MYFVTVASLPRYTFPLAPLSVSFTRRFAKSSGVLLSSTSSPFARSEMFFATGAYTEPAGRSCLVELDMMLDLIAPVTHVTTFTPKGANSSRSVSLIRSMAALEPP